ncbi:hypothetical protein CMO83_05185 [Candidatus Woesearchaeota archaeon]|jgi:hypothetical protein|nr:hypothetical protein [Candidatus Woesearchaeota archaeon]|tara:strand:+ start:15376 stop:16500 length:1125 start_codon:yes stop_codon:yes gene_type:complete
MTEEGLKLNMTVAGNAALDADLEGIVEIELPDSVTVTSGSFFRDFIVEDGPITHGYKHTVMLDASSYQRGMEDYIRGLKFQLKPGGGNINTAVSLIARSDFDSDVRITILDMSQNDPVITHHLDDSEILHHFFGYRPSPVNAVIGGHHDKIILKGPRLPRKQLLDEHRAVIDDVIEQSDGLIVNGAKDEDFVEALLQSAQRRNIPVFFMVTPSLDKDFVYERVLPAGVTLFGYEDLVRINGYNPMEFDKAGLRNVALEHMRQIRADSLSNGHPLIVTLGSGGVLYSYDGTKIYRTGLTEEHGRRVGTSIKSRFGKTSGAGDTFLGDFARQYLERAQRQVDLNMTTLVQRASKAAIRHLGHEGRIQYHSFFVSEV